MSRTICWFTSSTSRCEPKRPNACWNETELFRRFADFNWLLMMPAGLPRPKRIAFAPREMSTRSVLYESIGMLVRKKSRVRSAPASPRTRVEFCGFCSVDSALEKRLPVSTPEKLPSKPPASVLVV